MTKSRFALLLLVLLGFFSLSYAGDQKKPERQTVTFEAAKPGSQVFLCAGKTKAGVACKRHVKAAGVYCWQHKTQSQTK